jgi:hypothetical protein
MRLTLPLVLLLASPLASPLAAQSDSAAIPALGARVTRIRFFEGSATLPAMLERRYAARFDSAATRTIYVEIGLAYPPAPEAVSVRIECGYFTPGGQSAGTAVVLVQADQGWELSVHAGGAGSDAPGGWQAGAYTVACRHAGKVIATGTFEIARPAGKAAPPPRAATNATKPAAKAPVPFGTLKAKVTAVRLFESGPQPPDRKNRVITSSFDAMTTRLINIELELTYPTAARRTQLDVPCQIEGPDSVERIPVVKVDVDAGWAGSYHSTAWGSGNRGGWPEGSYRLTCREQNQTVATAEFNVVKSPPAVAALDASLTHIRFFQSLGDRLPVEGRHAGTRFDATALRWVKTEFGLVYPPPSAATVFTVGCTYTFPEGTLRPVTVERRIPAGWTGSVHTQGIGFDQPGSWPAGSYKVSCQNEGREFAAGTFEVFDGNAAAAATPGGSLRFFSGKAGAAGPAAYTQSFELGAFDTLYAEASVPTRSAGDSTTFRCAMTDPAGITSGFTLNGAVRDRALTGTGRIGALESQKLRGSYRVECRVGARAVASDRFDVAGPAELTTIDSRLLASAMYDGTDVPPDDEAVPDVTFSAAKLRSLWLVALFDHPTDTGAGTVAYSCKITGARNAVISDSGPQQLAVATGTRAIVLRQRFVPRPRQRWTAGKYTLTCDSAGTSLFKTSLELGR